MLIMALCVLFFLPAYYIGKSKGYGLLPQVIVYGGIGIAGTFALAILVDDTGLLAQFAFPASILLIAWLLPTRKGAPGKKYLKITFICPECGEEVAFPRHKEGLAELCPKCREIVTVPTDEFSPKPAANAPAKPDAQQGLVAFTSFGDEMAAAQFRALLENNGISAEVFGATGGGALPYLSGTEGFRVMIDATDWDRAEAVQQGAAAEILPTAEPSLPS